MYCICLTGTCLYAALRSFVPCRIRNFLFFWMPPERWVRRANSRAIRIGKSARPQVIRSCMLVALLCLERLPLSMQRHFPFCLIALRPMQRHLPRLYFLSMRAFEKGPLTRPSSISSFVRCQHCCLRSMSSSPSFAAAFSMPSEMVLTILVLFSMNSFRLISAGWGSFRNTPESGMLKTTSKPFTYLTGRSVSGQSIASMTAAVQATLKAPAISCAALHLCLSSALRMLLSFAAHLRRRSMRSFLSRLIFLPRRAM